MEYKSCPCVIGGPHSTELENYQIQILDQGRVHSTFTPCKQHGVLYSEGTSFKRIPLETNPVRYYYIRDNKGTPVACLASKVVGKRVYAGLSVWNQKLDKFDKNEAKKYALERLNGSFGAKFTYVAQQQGAKTTIMADIVTDQEVPNRVRNAAFLWFSDEMEKN